MNKKIIGATIVIIVIVISTLVTISLLQMLTAPEQPSGEEEPTNPTEPGDEDLPHEILESKLEAALTATNVTELKKCLHTVLKNAAGYLFYLFQGITRHYGSYNDVVVNPTIDSQGFYQYIIVLDWANWTGFAKLSSTRLINGFLIQSLTFFESYLTSLTLSDVCAEFQAIPGDKALFLARDDIILLENTTDNLAVGSIFKLFILEALRQKINTNSTINWQTELPILDTLKSLPSGIIHTWANGTVVTLKALADYMMNISDNTATDHLIHFLGRIYVESFLPSGYALPLLKTADMFKLRYLATDSELSNYLSMNVSQKRAYLDDVVYNMDIQDIYSINVNVTHNLENRRQLEYYFNATDIYSILNTTKDLDSTQINPGLADVADWTAVSYKGGSDFGILGLAHAVQAQNGSWYYLILIVNNFEELPFIEYGEYVYDQIGMMAICEKLFKMLVNDQL